MKQFLFLAALTIVWGVASIFQPFWGVLLYYALAVLCPQYLWDWALPLQVRWSLVAEGQSLQLGLWDRVPRG